MKYFFAIILLLTFSFQGNGQLTMGDLHTGDLVFVGKGSGQLSNAISDVTQTALATSYSHIGILEEKDKDWFLLHADPKSGTSRISFRHYLETAKKEKEVIDIYRIQNISELEIAEALTDAKSKLGLPYNFSYVRNDTSYYCSDFIQEIFNNYSVFTLASMTFKNPGSLQYNSTWIEYYEKIGIPIPEGALGCNPNGMAASPRLIYLGTLIEAANQE